jgi:dolichol kinase
MRSMLGRRLWHISTGLGIVAAAWLLPKTTFLLSLVVVTFLFLTFEAVRLRASSLNKWFCLHFGSLLRKEEVSHVTTSSYVLIAALVAYLAFGRDIAVLSVCFLAVGDVAAGVVGWHMGRTRLFGKALEGDLACLVSCLAAGFLLHYAGLNVGLVTITAGALGATIGQAISGPVDDNLTLPLLAGVAMAAVPP